MRIFILTLGTRGDLELFATLASELKRRGHQVVIGTSPFYATRLQAVGLQWRQIGNGTSEQMQSALRELGGIKEPDQRTRHFIQRWIKPQLDASKSMLFSYALSADYFISNLKMAIPRRGQTVPGAFVTYDMPDPGTDMSAAPNLHGGRIIELVAMSKSLVDGARVWNQAYQFTGFWFPIAPSWMASTELINYLAGGKPPVVFTLGSMSNVSRVVLTDMFIDAIQQSGDRGLILGGADNRTRRGDQLKTVHFETEVPYQWLFPKVAGVVHHGGVGTVAACLLAGKPFVVLPHISAQHLLTQILSASGVVAGVIRDSELDSRVLSEAITKMTDAKYIQTATTWQRQIAVDGGVTCAADMVESHQMRLGIFG